MHKSISLFSLCLVLGTTVSIGADLFDAPGPGYREQNGVERGGMIERLELRPKPPIYPTQPGAVELFLRKHLELKRGQDPMGRIADLDGVPEYPSREFTAKFLSFQSEMRRLTGGVPEFPSDNVFATPLKLFGALPAHSPGQIGASPWKR